MKLKWYGHSCFLITSHNGTRILTDPFDSSVGYPVPHLDADIVTISHNHYDHNNTKAIRSDFVHLSRPGLYNTLGFSIHGVHSWHDASRGAKRGSNTIFIFDIDSLRVCHCGDLGMKPDKDEISEITGTGNIDILMIPVGGIYTIDAVAAMEIVGTLGPRIVIPMHYKTPEIKITLEGVDNFLQLARNDGKPKYIADDLLSEGIDIVMAKSSEITISKSTLPGKTTIMLMHHG